MKDKKGFTLIELLAVIIILGILMIIAIPSVTKYISDSRKSSYIDTAKEIIGGARNLVNDGSLEMYDTNVTYYMDTRCVKTENASKSPYGEFAKSYVVITYNGKGYDYYWTSVDKAGMGIKKILKLSLLNEDEIVSDLKESDILNNVGIDGRSKYIIIDDKCNKGIENDVSSQVDSNTGEEYELPAGSKVNVVSTLDGVHQVFLNTLITVTATLTCPDDSFITEWQWKYATEDNVDEFYNITGDEPWFVSIENNGYTSVFKYRITYNNAHNIWRATVHPIGKK